MNFTARQWNTIQAGLRLWQEYLDTGKLPDEANMKLIMNIAKGDDDERPHLDGEAIDKLCERINRFRECS